MDLRTVLTFVAAMLIQVESDEAPLNPTSAPDSQTSRALPPEPRSPRAGSTASGPPSPRPPPVLAMLEVRLDRACEGEVRLSLEASASAPVCVGSGVQVLQRLSHACLSRSGCSGPPVWVSRSGSSTEGYRITPEGRLDNATCLPLRVQCQVVPAHTRELVGYKVTTGLLCVMVLAVLLVRFGRPSFKAFTKKMSDRRQSRWIGPTQSQSVSYHRGKAAVQTDHESDKRLSYPD